LKAIISNLKYFIPAIIWALIILFLSSGPGIQLPKSTIDLSIDKLGHFVFYGILAFLIAYGYYKHNPAIHENGLFKALIISGFYGICLEIMQYSFFPNRYFEVLDIIANISGSLIGILFFKYIYYKTR